MSLAPAASRLFEGLLGCRSPFTARGEKNHRHTLWRVFSVLRAIHCSMYYFLGNQTAVGFFWDSPVRGGLWPGAKHARCRQQRSEGGCHRGGLPLQQHAAPPFPFLRATWTLPLHPSDPGHAGPDLTASSISKSVLPLSLPRYLPLLPSGHLGEARHDKLWHNRHDELWRNNTIPPCCAAAFFTCAKRLTKMHKVSRCR